MDVLILLNTYFQVYFTLFVLRNFYDGSSRLSLKKKKKKENVQLGFLLVLAYQK